MPLITDQIDIKRNPLTWDIPATGDLEMTTGIEAVVQGARDRILLVKGEWFLDLDAGVPWYERDGVPSSTAIYGQRFNRTRATNAMRDALLTVPGVVSLLRLEVSFDVKTRTLTIVWQARTEFGDTPTDTLALGK